MSFDAVNERSKERELAQALKDEKNSERKSIIKQQNDVLNNYQTKPKFQYPSLQRKTISIWNKNYRRNEQI